MNQLKLDVKRLVIMWLSIILIYSVFLYTKSRKGEVVISKSKTNESGSSFSDDDRHKLGKSMSLGNIYYDD